MFDVALASAGAQVVLASSCDEKYPPENIIDGSTDTFWSSTGLFPQELVVTFASLMNIDSIRIHCSNVRKLQLQRSVQNEPVDFEPLDERELESTDGHLQMEELNLGNVTAQHLRIVVQSGYDHFVSLHKLHVDGNAVHS